MKEFKPEAMLVSLSVERSAARLPEQELKRYQLEKVRNAEMLIADPAFTPDFSDDLTGDLLEMAWNTSKAGIDAARKRHFSNPSGKATHTPPIDTPMATHTPPTDTPMATHTPPNSFIHSFNHSYTHIDTNAPQPPEEPEPPPEEHKKQSGRFTPPTLEEVTAYCKERNNGISPEQFIDYYQTRGWILKPGQKVKDWKACIRTWEQNRKGGVNNERNRIPGQRDLYDRG